MYYACKLRLNLFASPSKFIHIAQVAPYIKYAYIRTSNMRSPAPKTFITRLVSYTKITFIRILVVRRPSRLSPAVRPLFHCKYIRINKSLYWKQPKICNQFTELICPLRHYYYILISKNILSSSMLSGFEMGNYSISLTNIICSYR